MSVTYFQMVQKTMQKERSKCNNLLIGNSGFSINRNPLYYFCNFSVSFKLFQGKSYKKLYLESK